MGDARVRSPVFVTNAPPDPNVKFNVPADDVVRIFAAAVPIALALLVGTERLIVPLVPTFNAVPAICVMAPLVPLLVSTERVPPFPVVISRSAAAPVPPPEALTLIATALLLVLLVVIELPAFIVKLFVPTPP